MHARPRRVLRQLIQRHGWTLVDDPRRVEAFLKDLCGQYEREIFVLVHAQEVNLPDDLVSAGRLAGDPAHWQRLSRRLQKRLAITRDAADWAVESWAVALGIEATERRWVKVLDRTTRPVTSALSSLAQGTPPGLTRLGRYLSGKSKQPRGQRAPVPGIGGLTSLRARLSGKGWLLGLILFAVIVPAAILAGVYDGAPQVLGESPVFWQPGQPLAAPEQESVLNNVGTALEETFSLPRSASLQQDLVTVYAEPSIGSPSLGQIGPSQAIVTVQSFSSDGKWSHIGEPISGWLDNRMLAFAMDGEDDYRLRVEPSLGTVTAAGLRLRQQPATSALILDSLFTGETVVIIAVTVDESWYYIVEPGRGWLSSDFVRRVSS